MKFFYALIVTLGICTQHAEAARVGGTSNLRSLLKSRSRLSLGPIRKFAEKIVKPIAKVVDPIAKVVDDTAKRTWNSVTYGSDYLMRQAQDAPNRVWNGVTYASEQVMYAAQDAATRTWNGVEYASVAVMNEAKEVASRTADGFLYISQEAMEVSTEAAKGIETAVDDIKNAAVAVADEVKKLGEGLWKCMEQTVENLAVGPLKAIECMMGKECINEVENDIENCITNPKTCQMKLSECLPKIDFSMSLDEICTYKKKLCMSGSVDASTNLDLSFGTQGIEIGIDAFSLKFTGSVKRTKKIKKCEEKNLQTDYLGGTNNDKCKAAKSYEVLDTRIFEQLIMLGEIPMYIELYTNLQLEAGFEIDGFPTAYIEGDFSGSIQFPKLELKIPHADSGISTPSIDLSSSLTIGGIGFISGDVYFQAGPSFYLKVNGEKVADVGPFGLELKWPVDMKATVEGSTTVACSTSSPPGCSVSGSGCLSGDINLDLAVGYTGVDFGIEPIRLPPNLPSIKSGLSGALDCLLELMPGGACLAQVPGVKEVINEAEDAAFDILNKLIPSDLVSFGEKLTVDLIQEKTWGLGDLFHINAPDFSGRVCASGSAEEFSAGGTSGAVAPWFTSSNCQAFIDVDSEWCRGVFTRRSDEWNGKPVWKKNSGSEYFISCNDDIWLCVYDEKDFNQSGQCGGLASTPMNNKPLYEAYPASVPNSNC